MLLLEGEQKRNYLLHYRLLVYNESLKPAFFFNLDKGLQLYTNHIIGLFPNYLWFN